jgi:hypothetical protein
LEFPTASQALTSPHSQAQLNKTKKTENPGLQEVAEILQNTAELLQKLKVGYMKVGFIPS